MPSLGLAPQAAQGGEQGVGRIGIVHALEVAVHGLLVLAEVGREGRVQLGGAAVAPFDLLCENVVVSHCVFAIGVERCGFILTW